MSFSMINDQFQLGRFSILQVMREMLEAGDDINKIDFDVLIKEEEEKDQCIVETVYKNIGNDLVE